MASKCLSLSLTGFENNVNKAIRKICCSAILIVIANCLPLMAAKPGLLEIPKVTKDKIICFALYTLHNSILKMTAQLYPLDDDDPRTVRLEIKTNGSWVQIAESQIIERGYIATFRIKNWDSSQDIEYRLAHDTSAFYAGTVKRDPVDKDVIVVAAFTGNSIYPRHSGDIPKTDIVENIKKINPDLLFFSGDQVYDHKRHYAYWLKFGRDFGDII